jgi:hypothetical protein
MIPIFLDGKGISGIAGTKLECGTRHDGIRALAANPLVMSLTKAETLYDDMSSALRDFLPARLVA